MVISWRGIKGVGMKLITFTIIIFLCLPAQAEETVTYIDEEGVTHVIIKGETPPAQTYELPSWKDEVNKFCNKAINAQTLSEHEISTLLKESATLKTVAETTLTDPSLKLATLKLIGDCESRINSLKYLKESKKMIEELKNRR
ncbi:hypothetical protein C4544_07425 [candidate division WS5 bacterium]|uniref:DUF5667 domain-containing protein n=1 Tax=candidate division WS5 bacterium TaxID=2093353 RepID=A0A419D9X2_9BACT|nr:MAG: hypothetical protein C4544_07425 [candidate division WS5 bacterium]